MKTRRGVVVGAGYFSDFHLDAWRRLTGVQIVSVCDLEEGKARAAAAKYGIAEVATDPRVAIERDDIDFVDIATPPTGRLPLVELAVQRGLAVICPQ